MGLYGGGGGINIAAVAELMRATEESWMNGLIQIIDPNIGEGNYSVLNNRTTGGEPVVLWEGKARIQPIRAATPSAGTFENASIRGVRFKIPLGADIGVGPIREGLQIYVIDGGEDESLTHYNYIISNGINSSLAWNRTIEATVDLGAVRTAPAIAGYGYGLSGYGTEAYGS